MALICPPPQYGKEKMYCLCKTCIFCKCNHLIVLQRGTLTSKEESEGEDEEDIDLDDDDFEGDTLNSKYCCVCQTLAPARTPPPPLTFT